MTYFVQQHVNEIFHVTFTVSALQVSKLTTRIPFTAPASARPSTISSKIPRPLLPLCIGHLQIPVPRMKHSSTISKLPHRSKPTGSSNVELASSPSDASIPAGPLSALEHSPFRRLPAKIRREILAMALKQEDDLIFTASWWQCSHNGTPASKRLSLRATCRQIYRETEALFFGLNDINLDYLISSKSGVQDTIGVALA